MTIAATPLRSRRRSRASTIAVVAAFAVPAFVMAVLGGARAIGLSLSRDEMATMMFAALSPAELGRAVMHVDAVLAPYYAVAGVASALVPGDAGLRLPSLVAAVATTVAVTGLARRWWGTTSGLVAGIVFATNPLAVQMAATARPYALAILAVVLAVLAADRAALAAGRGVGRWAAYAACVVAAGLMHLFAILAVLPVAILCGARGRRSLVRFAAATVAAGLVLLPFTLLATSQRAQVGWIEAPDAATAARILTNVVAYRSAGPADVTDVVVYALTGGLAVLGIVLTVRAALTHGDRIGLARMATALGMAIAPWAVLLVVSLTVVPALRTAYLAPSVLGVALVVAGSVHAVVASSAGRRRAPDAAADRVARSRRTVVAGVVIAAQVLFVGTSTLADTRATWWQDDFRGLAEVVDQRARPGDVLVVVQRHHETGLAGGLARYAGDATYARELADRLPDGAQPLVDVRRVVGTAPLRTEDVTGRATAPAGRVWLVTTRSPLTGREFAALEQSGFACVSDASPESAWRFGGVRLVGSCEP